MGNNGKEPLKKEILITSAMLPKIPEEIDTNEKNQEWVQSGEAETWLNEDMNRLIAWNLHAVFQRLQIVTGEIRLNLPPPSNLVVPGRGMQIHRRKN